MGKQLKNASAKTWQSLLLFYNKCITLVFALFCAGFGSAVKAAPLIPPDTSVTVKGKAYKMPGKTPLRSVKLYLCEVWYALYGTSCNEQFFPVDTTETDSAGTFIFKNIPKIRSGVREIGFSLYESTSLSKVQEYRSTTQLLSANLKDTSVTLYLEPYICVGVIDDMKIPEQHKTVTVQYGQNIIMRLPDRFRSQINSAVILTLKGEKTGSVDIGSDGSLSLNTTKYTPGTYIMSIKNNKTQFLQRILIK